MFSSLFRNKSLQTMSAFIQKLNPLTGLNEWVIQSEDYDYHQEVARAAFADMLHDTERNDMYEEALKIAIKHMHSRGLKANVLDIGAGTGLLSMMAVRHGADSVVACEAFKPMSQCALEVIKLNNCYDKIKLIPKRSTDIIVGSDMDFKANILVTEVFDTELIGEGALGTFRHAHQYLLEADCIVVPHSATIYAQIVESPLLADWNRLKNIFNNDGELELQVPALVKACPGSASLHDVQLSQLPLESVKTLVAPQRVFPFDFSGRTPIVFDRCSIITTIVDQEGTAQGVFMWWELNMDIDNKIILSCAPYWAHPKGQIKDKEIPWRDHWMQAIYYFPNEVHLEKGSEVKLISCHDEYSLWFSIKMAHKFIKEEDNMAYIKCCCNLHKAYARTRIGQLNDSKRTKKYMRIIEEHIDKDSVVLVLSQGFYVALTAAKRARKVYFLETNRISRQLTEAFIKENNLRNVEIINGEGKQVLKEKANVVLAEPYYTSSIVPWDNCMFLHLLNVFEKSLTEDVRIFPKEIVVHAMGVQFDNLHKIRAPLGSCNGFLMEPFDQLIERSCTISDDIVEAQPLWEYPGIAVTHPKEIARFKLNLPTKENMKNETTTTFEILDGFQCNGIAVWVDWILDDEDVKHSTVTSGPVNPVEIGEYIKWDLHSRQGVCLLGNREMPNLFEYVFKYDFNAQCSIVFKPVLR